MCIGKVQPSETLARDKKENGQASGLKSGLLHEEMVQDGTVPFQNNGRQTDFSSPSHGHLLSTFLYLFRHTLLPFRGHFGFCPAPTCTRSAHEIIFRMSDTKVKLVVAIDFGTTFSGAAWALSTDPDELEHISMWPNHTGDNALSGKVPTRLMRVEGDTSRWGFLIPRDAPLHQVFRCFKLYVPGHTVDEHVWTQS